MIVPDGKESRSGAFLCILEWRGDDFPVSLLQQDFDLAFRLFQFLLAFARELHSFFEQAHGLIQRKIGAFQALDDFFQPRQRFFEFALARRFGGFVRS